MKELQTFSPALIILDIGLPDASGFDVCREIRKSSNIPLLFLTARGEEIDRIMGLELGADDYVTKPFSGREVVARVRALLRRSSPDHSTADLSTRHLSEPLQTHSKHPRFTVDAAKFIISFDTVPIPLSRYEYRLLLVLLARPGRVYSREELMNRAWETPEMSLERTVDTHIKTIRAKLRSIAAEEDLIITHRGLGYSLREH